MVNARAVVLYPSKLFPELAVSFLSFGFFIATEVYPVANNAPRSKLLITLLVITSILSAVGGFTRYSTDRTVKRLYETSADAGNTKQWFGIVKKMLQPSRAAFLLLHGPAVILVLYLTARLYGFDNFRTQPTNLDFGPKYGRVNSDGSYETNIAFEPKFSSFGHAFQGFLAALLSFPAVSGWLARKIGSIGMGGNIHLGRVRIILSITTLAYSFITLYPTYNLIKRVAKHPPTFASTSYANNCMEWSMGYTLGLALGMCLTSIMRWLLVVVYPKKHVEGLEAFMKTFDASQSVDAGLQYLEDGSTENTKYVFGKLEEYILTPQYKCCASLSRHVDCFTIVTMLSNLALAVFSISVLLCGIYMGATWNKCLDGDGDTCINSTTNGVDMGSRLVLTFIMAYIVIETVFVGIAMRMYGLLI